VDIEAFDMYEFGVQGSELIGIVKQDSDSEATQKRVMGDDRK
jgi:hypothetical protein